VTLQVSPTIIQNGQSATLTWSSTNATSLSLSPGVGNVTAEGSTHVSPTDSTTYTITATGPGGSADATARVSVIRTDTKDALAQTAQFLRSNPQVKVVVEGHADERGSTEYNLALGDRRAAAAKQFLVSLGLSADRMETVSYGKERPFCSASNEECWQQNRRAHFVLAK
jgi:peptidoglycan-associated lipoprotein